MESMDEDPTLRGLLTMTPGGVIAAGVVMPLLGCIAVGLRFYSRRWQHLEIQADDWTMLAGSLLVGILGLILIVGSGIGGLGLHSLPASSSPSDNPKGDTIAQGPADGKAEASLRAYSIVEKPAFALIKISIVLLYRRIFRGGAWCLVVAASVAVLSLATVAFVVVSAMQCRRRNWELRYATWALRHHCVSAEMSTFAFAIFDVATDLAVLLMPLPAVWSLKMSARRKAVVFAVFALACSSFAVGMVRLAVITTFTYYGGGGGGGDDYSDLLGVMSTVPTLSIVEAGIAIVAASTPTFRRLVAAKVFRTATSETSSSRPRDYTSDRSGAKTFAFPGGQQRSHTNNEDLELDNLILNRSAPAGNVTK